MESAWEDPVAELWEKDQLDRANVARFLTRYLHGLYGGPTAQFSTDGFVLALNASWGFGKSFLLRRWSDDLRRAGYPVVLFDAWESDYSREPLVGFMAEMEAQLAPWLKENKHAKKPFQKVKLATRKVVPALAGIFGGRAVGELTDQTIQAVFDWFRESGATPEAIASGEALAELKKDVGKESGTFISKSVERALDAHMSTKEAIHEFKNNLRDLISTIRDAKSDGSKDIAVRLPMFIFVDELDRCRPTYAIELLENVKHLFGVDGLYFVVAINKQQLVHSIRAVYGGEFDASGYLTRFFDQEYELPLPNNSKYAKYLFDQFQLSVDHRLANPLPMEFYQQPTANAELFAVMATAFGLSLRAQKQVVHRLKAIMAVYDCQRIQLAYLLFLLMLRHKDSYGFEEVVRSHNPAYDSGLKCMADRGASLLARRSGQHDRGQVASITVESIFRSYHNLSSDSARDISNRERHYLSNDIEDWIDSEMRREAIEIVNDPVRRARDRLTIGDYPELVRQVGHLI